MLLAIALAVVARPADASIRRIQRVVASGSSGTVVPSWPRPTKPGNLLVAVVQVNDANDVITIPSGSSWTLALRANSGVDTGVAIYYWANAPAQAGSSSWTINTGTWLDSVVTLIEYAGAKLSSPLDKTGSWTTNTVSSTSLSVSTSATTTQADEIAVTGWVNDGSGTYSSWTNSFNEQTDTVVSNMGAGTADSVLSATGTITSGVTLSSANSHLAGVIATFKAETSTTRYWKCSAMTNFDENRCWTSTTSGSTNDVPAPDMSGTMTAIFNGTGVGDAVIRFDPNLSSLQLNSGYTGTVRQMTGGMAGLVGEYYSGTAFTTYMGTYIEGPIDFQETGTNWDDTVVAPRVKGSGDAFAVRWTGQVQAPVGTSITFYSVNDDGAKLTVNGTQLFNDTTTSSSSTNSGSITLTAGNWYDISFEYYDVSGTANVALQWSYTGQSQTTIPVSRLRTKGSTGIQTEYYDGWSGFGLGTSFKHRELNSNIGITYNSWDDNIVGPITDSYDGDTWSLAWEGQVLAGYTEAYTFYSTTDDGVRVWVNGQLVIDGWSYQGSARTGSPTISLTAGNWYDVRVELYEDTGGAQAVLAYQSTSQANATIPTTALRSAAPITLASYTQGAGTFVGGSARMNVTGDFSATAGSFTAPSGLLSIGGAFSSSGCTFTGNGGRVLLASTSSKTLNPGASNSLNDLYVNPGLVGYWKLDESSISSQSSAADSSGYGHTAYHVNTPTASTTIPSAVGFYDQKSVQFAMATRHALRTPLTTELKPTSYLSIAFWYKATQVDSGLSASDIVSGGDNYTVRLRSGSIQFQNRYSGGWQTCTASPNTLDGNWHHVAVVRDIGSGTVIYFDGASSATCSAAADMSAIVYDQGRELWLGRHGYAGTATDFDGYLDDVRIYNVPLTKSEVSALAAGRNDGYATGTYTLSSNLTTAGSVYLNGGYLDVSATPYNITVGGNWWNHGGRFTARTGTVTFTGTTTSILSNNEPFYNLTQSGNSYTGSYSQLTVVGTVAVNAGTIDTWGYATRLGNVSDGGGRFYPNSSSTLSPTSNVTASMSGGTWAGYAEIEATNETNLQRYYKFDDLHGRTARDWSGNASDATANGGIGWTTSVPSGIAYQNWGATTADGSDDYWQFTAPAATKITISAWIKPSNCGDDWGRIVDMPAYKLYLSRAGGATDNAMALQLQMVTGNGIYVYQTSANAVAYSSWYHVVATFDSTTFVSGTSSTYPKFYVNGTLLTTGVVSTTTGTFASNAGTAYIGDRGTTDRSFCGSIDDVRIYDAVISQTQVSKLASGYYPIGSSYSVTLGSSFATSSSLQIDSGTLDVAGQTLTTGDANTPIYINNGTLNVGSGTVTAAGGLWANRLGTLSFNGSGTLKIPSGETLTMNGNLTTTAGFTPTIQNNGSGSYTFTVNSDTNNPYAVINVDGLNLKNMDQYGFNVQKATSTTFTSFQNVNFSSGPGSAVSGSRHMYISGDSLYESFPGVTFDLGASRTTAINVSVAGTGSRFFFEDRGTTTSGAGVGESYDADGDTTAIANAVAAPDGLADANASVVQWVWAAPTDMAGTIIGFPAPAFDWSTFTYYSTYVAMKDIDGTTDRIYVRNTNGSAKSSTYYWDLPSGNGDIIGTPRWDKIGSTRYVWVGTTTGKIYRLIDDGASLALGTSPWNAAYAAGNSVTSPLLVNSSYIYFTGTDGSNNPKLFRLAQDQATFTNATIASGLTAALAFDNPSASTYVFSAASGHVYRHDGTNIGTSPVDNTTLNPGTITGRVVVLNNVVYMVDAVGKVTAASTASFASGTTAAWTYQDGSTSNHTSGCPTNANCQAQNVYVNLDDYISTGGKPRVVFGDKDGHVYVVRNSSGTTGAAYSGYPYQVNSDTGTISTAPLYQSGILVYGNDNGSVYVVDAFSATGPATPKLIQAYKFGTVAVSSISRDKGTNSNNGAYVVATADGKLFYISASTDPSSSFK